MGFWVYSYHEYVEDHVISNFQTPINRKQRNINFSWLGKRLYN